MKISLQLSGTYRNLEYTVEYYKHIFREHELDIFLCISTLFDYTDSKFTYNPNQKYAYSHKKYDKSVILNKDKLDEHLRDKFDFKDFYIVDKDNELRSNTNKIFFKKKICNDLRINYSKKNGIKYDIVISSRTDWLMINIRDILDLYMNTHITEDNLVFPYHMTKEEWNALNMPNFFVKKSINMKHPVFFDTSFKDILNNKNTIYTADSTMGPSTGISKNFSIWDGFAYGSPEMMDIYVNFNFSDESQKPPNINLWKNGKCPESRLQNYLLKQNINIKGLYKEFKMREYWWRRELDETIKNLLD